MKNHIALLVVIASLALASCGAPKTTTVQGKALNAKLGAVVQSEKGVYYICGMKEWPKKYYGKKVEVTGLYSFINHKKKSTKKRPVTEIVGKQKFISKAKYRLILKENANKSGPPNAAVPHR